MVDPHANGCLEPEVLAAYVDRGLSLSERARVEAHLASCPQCIAQVAGVARTVAELSASRPDVAVAAEATPLVTRRSLAGALAAAAAVIAVVATPSLVRPWVDRDAGLVNLVERVGEQRSVLGRLTGGFPHTPLGVPSAGGQDGQAAGTDRVQLTAGKIRESVGERETPSELHALGVSQLLAGRYDDAAQALLAASREQPANARFLSDVAAVQLERARLGLRPDDLPRALAAADRARRLDPSLREAWFNRALAASALSLNADARSAWTEYLKRDSSSPWATEARQRLAELSKPSAAEAWGPISRSLEQSITPEAAEQAVRTQTTEARNYIEQLLSRWGGAAAAGVDASDMLERARTMAAAYQRITSDALYFDAVAAIDRSVARGPAAAAQLARAHVTYADAAGIYADDRYAAAEAGLQRATAELESAGSPFAARGRIDLATIDSVFGRYEKARPILEHELEAARANNYRSLSARASWVLGLAAFVQGRHGDARANYEDTLTEFAAIGDAEQVAAAHNLLAALFSYIGDDSQTWAHLIPALKGLAVTRSFKLRHGLLTNAALNVRGLDGDAALAIQNEVIRNAQAWGRAAAIAEAHAQRATLFASLGQSDAAKQDVVEARQHLSAGQDPALQARIEPIVLSTESELLRTANPAAAVKAAEAAIAIASGRGDKLRVARLQLQLAQANIVWGRTAAAELALEDGIATFEKERLSMPDEGRISSRDELWGLFETSVHLAIKKKDLDRAFAMAERARVRTLFEAQRIQEPRSLKSVQAALAADEALVALNQFDDELAIWVIRSTTAEVITRPLVRHTAEQLVARLQSEIWQSSADTTASRLLFNEVLRPVATQLEGVRRLIVVPDQTYADTSFAALVDGRTNRFVFENQIVVMATSASDYVGHAGTRMAGRGAGALVVDAAERADSSARTIAALYSPASLLTGSSVTPDALFAASAQRSVIHVSAPLSPSATNPMLSRLMVADDPGSRYSGAITGSEIVQRPWSLTRLVVLDEVRTSQSHRGEGTSSLARAFIAAGVPAVLGTLRGADESAARDLLIGFHREMSKGMSAEQALQTVQRNAIQQNGRRLGAWSALVLYGSDR